MEHMLLTSLSMTPYDTGERLEPQLWPTSDDPETFGRVDFDDDEGRTVLTAYVERRGLDYVLHVGSSCDKITIEMEGDC